MTRAFRLLPKSVVIPLVSAVPAGIAGGACDGPPVEAVVDAGATIDATPGGVAEIGTGMLEFEPVAAEEELGLVAGPQGGYHFIVHARIREMEPGDPMRAGIPENPFTRFTCFSEDGRRIDVGVPPGLRIGYRTGDGGWYELPSGRILQIYNEEVPGVVGQRVKISVDVSDAAGHRAIDERWIVVRPWDELAPDASTADAAR
jgi:hypothetical protein